MVNPYLWLAICFFSGWAAGIVVEYFLHWLMHRWTALGFHIGHHKEFFHLESREVAQRALHPRFDLLFFGIVLAIISPLFWWSFWPVLFFWLGTAFHIVIVYELCHFIMHDDSRLPQFVRGTEFYRWWKDCHFEHHRHSPAGNFCVTVPVFDRLMGTYVHPRENLSMPELKRTEPRA